MEFGVPRVVARVNNPKNAWLYNNGMGVDIAVNQLIKDLSIPKGMLLIAIIRGEALIVPKGDTQILAADEILTFTDEASRKKLEEIFK